MSELPQPSSPRTQPPQAAVRIAHTIQLRIRYSETDQMGTFYNSRPLDWFECGRTELLRSIGLPYAELERRGLFLPLVEARVEYLSRARYDDPIDVRTTATFEGRARLRCDVEITHGETSRPVVRGHTVHAFTDNTGKAIRPPGWIIECMARGAGFPAGSASQTSPQPDLHD